MKRRLVADLERSIVDLRDAIAAIETDDISSALARFRSISTRLRSMISELVAEAKQ